MRIGPRLPAIPSPSARPAARARPQTPAAQAPSAQVQAAAVNSVKARAATPTPAQLDGMLLSPDGAFPAGTPYTEVPPTKPSNGKVADGTLIFVNGMGESPANSRGQAQNIANALGMNVVNIYNATEGTVKDLIQAAGDTFNLGNNKAVDSLADQVYARLMDGESVRLMSHSQGALITSRALTDVRNRMVAEGGLTQAQAEELLSKVGVETLGGAAPNWPDGPRYVHYVNRSDFVPTFLGVGRNVASSPGRDAEVITFGRFNPFGGWFGGDAHSSTTYLKNYVPFDELHGASAQ